MEAKNYEVVKRVARHQVYIAKEVAEDKRFTNVYSMRIRGYEVFRDYKAAYQREWRCDR